MSAPEPWTDEWHVADAQAMRTGDYEAEMAELRAQIDDPTAIEFAILAELRELEANDGGAVDEVSDDAAPTGHPLVGIDEHEARHLVDGATFVLDGDTDVRARWGRDDAVLMPIGEALMICSPPGVGKTTLGLQFVDASIGAGPPELLGFPVMPARRVLYLAMDRPKQIKRAMRRLWTEDQRDVLEDRLRVWYGPLPFDLGENASGLLRMAEWADADLVVIDSLKDAAVQLTDDRTAGMVNRSIQMCLANDVDILALHHQRKGQNGEKPKRLEDVYGSTWITAGMGSVALLWGAAGDSIVELVHLKQPAAEVGPFKIEHDHNLGRSSIYSGFDLERFVAMKANGVTAIEVARAMTEKTAPTDNERKKAQRQLDAAVTRGRMVKRDAVQGGAGGATGARYFRADQVLMEAS